MSDGLGARKQGCKRENGKEKSRKREERGCGGVQPPLPPRHNTTAPEEPFCARGSIRFSLFLYYELLTRTCLSGSSLISSLPFRLPGGFFPFRDPIRKAHPFFVNLISFYEHVRCGLWALKWALSPLGPLWAL